MLQYTENDVVPNNIMVFGCGGTGSRVVPTLSQLIKSQSWLINANIILIDGDEVEEKNTSRQNFIMQDVGQNKAKVLATRYSQAFDIPLRFYPHFIEGGTVGRTYNSTHLGERSYTLSGIQQGTSVCYGRFYKKQVNPNESVIKFKRSEDLGDGPMTESQKEAYKIGDMEKMYMFLSGDTIPDMLSISTASDRHVSTSRNNNNDLSVRKALYNKICVDPVIAIICVDSAEARRKIFSELTVVNPDRKVFVIDAGNEDIYGQVSIFRLDHRASYMDLTTWNKTWSDVENHFAGSAQILSADPTGKSPLRKLFAVQRGGCKAITQYKTRYQLHFNRFLEEAHNHDADAELLYSKRPIAKHLKGTAIGSYFSGLHGEDTSIAKALKGLIEERGTTSAKFCSSLSSRLIPNRLSAKMDIPILPCPDMFYDTLPDGEGTRSCADLDQTLAINYLMAGAIIGVMNNLVYAQPFDFHTIRIGLNGSYSVDKMSVYWLKEILNGTNPGYSTSLVNGFLSEVNSLKEMDDRDIIKMICAHVFCVPTTFESKESLEDYVTKNKISLDTEKGLSGYLNSYKMMSRYLEMLQVVLQKEIEQGSPVAFVDKYKEAEKLVSLLHQAYVVNPVITEVEEVVKSIEDSKFSSIVLQDLYKVFMYHWMSGIHPGVLYTDCLNGMPHVETRDILPKVLALSSTTLDPSQYLITRNFPHSRVPSQEFCEDPTHPDGVNEQVKFEKLVLSIIGHSAKMEETEADFDDIIKEMVS